jgi:hypothetical protein
MKHMEGLSQREIHRRTGVHRDTIRRALALSEPPSYGQPPPRASKLDPFVGTFEELLADEPTLSGVRVREELLESRLGGERERERDSSTGCGSCGRAFGRGREASSAPATPGELAQFDLCESRSEVPVGFGQTRRGWVVACELPYSRAFAGGLVFYLDGGRGRRAARPGGSGVTGRQRHPRPDRGTDAGWAVNVELALEGAHAISQAAKSGPF